MATKRDEKLIELYQNQLKNHQENVQKQIDQLQHGLREEIQQSIQTFRHAQNEVLKQNKQSTIQDIRELLKEELNNFRQESREETRRQHRTHQTDNIQNNSLLPNNPNLPFINYNASTSGYTPNLPFTNYNASTSGSSSTSAPISVTNIPSNPTASNTLTTSISTLTSNNQTQSNASIPSNNNTRNLNPTIRTIETFPTSIRTNQIISNFKNLTPDKFDGLSSWNEYKIHFEIIASCNQWTDEIKASFLGASLQGKARNVLSKLTRTELTDFKKLTETLDNQFNKKHLSRMNLIKLKTRKQEKHENLETFAEEIDKLINSAFYGHSTEDKEEMACVYFIEGIYDRRIRYNLSYEHPKTLSAALERATVLEALSESIYPKTRSQNSHENNPSLPNHHDSREPNKYSQPNNSGSNNNHNKNQKCFRCNKPEHLARVCREPNPKQGN